MGCCVVVDPHERGCPFGKEAEQTGFRNGILAQIYGQRIDKYPSRMDGTPYAENGELTE